MAFIQSIARYLKQDIWRVQIKKLSRGRSMIVRLLRTIVIAFRGFREDKCQLRASALTFYSLMSVVPVFAMAFGVAKGFGFERLLETWMIQNFQGQEEVVGRVIEFARSLLDNAKGGLISGIGIIILFWVVMKVLGNIEHSFNDIWGVKKGRTFARKVADYLSIMLICPVLFIMASSLSVIVASQIKQIIISNNFLGTLNPIVLPALKLIPLGTIWFLFTFLYIFLPNTKVKFSSGLMAGIVAGTMYFALQMGYIKFQIGAAKMGAIYGSFAALPLFLIWVQLSWLVVLLGAELSFASQNVDTYEFEPDCLSVSNSYKKLLTLRITSLLVKNFHLAKVPITANQISHELEIPIR
ncbi:YihY/virulence factor BrkB family protein, partial [PVC group bacterium]|nr:YihY/virulence factor BrkB family protein [PVC group bacterium]